MSRLAVQCDFSLSGRGVLTAGSLRTWQKVVETPVLPRVGFGNSHVVAERATFASEVRYLSFPCPVVCPVGSCSVVDLSEEPAFRH